MRNWETSNYKSANELRAKIGLQFFAEGEGADIDSADMDADVDSSFEDDFFAEIAGDQREGAEEAGEAAPDDAGNQRTDEQDADAEKDPAEAETQETPPETATPQVVPLTYNGQQIPLPAEAVQALQGVLGANPVELLQKGLNYETKAERELRILDNYAKASGLSREAYVAQLEQQEQAERLNAELARVKQEFPGTPDEAAKAIAKARIDAQKQVERQQQAERQQQVAQGRARVQQQVEQARKQANIKAWDAYEKIAGVHKPEDIPPRVMELVQKEGLTPTEAHYRFESEQLKQKLEVKAKAQKNAAQTTGSMAGDAEPTGFEADFLRAFN